MSSEFALVQLIEANGYEVVNEHIMSCTYIESGDISGVKLILSLYDRDALYRDDVGIKKGTELNITFGDPDGRGDDSWSGRFIVEVPKVASDTLTLECWEYHSKQIKKLEPKPIFFVDMQPSSILGALVPGIEVIADSFPKAATYHLNAGGTRAKLIRNMARDYGAMAFISRNKLYFLSIPALTTTPEMTLESGNPGAEASIARYEMIGEDELHERIVDKSYMSWDTVEGMQIANKNTDKANTLISVPLSYNLENQNISLMPILDVELLGNGLFKPGMCLKVIFHKRVPDNVQDESLPSIQYINQVAHYQKGQKYLCKMELAVKHE